MIIFKNCQGKPTHRTVKIDRTLSIFDKLRRGCRSPPLQICNIAPMRSGNFLRDGILVRISIGLESTTWFYTYAPDNIDLS